MRTLLYLISALLVFSQCIRFKNGQQSLKYYESVEGIRDETEQDLDSGEIVRNSVPAMRADVLYAPIVLNVDDEESSVGNRENTGTLELKSIIENSVEIDELEGRSEEEISAMSDINNSVTSLRNKSSALTVSIDSLTQASSEAAASEEAWVAESVQDLESVQEEIDQLQEEISGIGSMTLLYYPDANEDYCEKHINCGVCISSSACIWCPSKETCVQGDANGPLIESCDSWLVNTCDLAQISAGFQQKNQKIPNNLVLNLDYSATDSNSQLINFEEQKIYEERYGINDSTLARDAINKLAEDTQDSLNSLKSQENNTVANIQSIEQALYNLSAQINSLELSISEDLERSTSTAESLDSISSQLTQTQQQYDNEYDISDEEMVPSSGNPLTNETRNVITGGGIREYSTNSTLTFGESSQKQTQIEGNSTQSQDKETTTQHQIGSTPGDNETKEATLNETEHRSINTPQNSQETGSIPVETDQALTSQEAQSEMHQNSTVSNVSLNSATVEAPPAASAAGASAPVVGSKISTEEASEEKLTDEQSGPSDEDDINSSVNEKESQGEGEVDKNNSDGKTSDEIASSDTSSSGENTQSQEKLTEQNSEETSEEHELNTTNSKNTLSNNTTHPQNNTQIPSKDPLKPSEILLEETS
ncbi:unnamed protein product [Moneuplotes crassus]|uniref:Uncharacterized protein n=1 Tax=Euplotes crassus TaxID=5936 RepID=A0AAD1Y8I6_EUPCR|nr:unnamed protein product [Moneuplotes crassus]